MPLRYAGAMRRVYPGFLQLIAFMSMNLERHLASFRGLFDDLVNNETEKAEATRSFYEEYFAVCDLPAEFYLETVQRVFQEYALAQGRAQMARPHGRSGGDPPHGAADRSKASATTSARSGRRWRRTTCAAGLRQYMKTHYVQAGAGHYGVFSGRRWSGNIYPVVRDVIHVSR